MPQSPLAFRRQAPELRGPAASEPHGNPSIRCHDRTALIFRHPEDDLIPLIPNLQGRGAIRGRVDLDSGREVLVV